jgi:hypothetical protein
VLLLHFPFGASPALALQQGLQAAQVAKAAKSSSCKDQQICLGQEDVSTEVTCNLS